MGINNRQRRAAKAKKRAQSREQRPGSSTRSKQSSTDRRHGPDTGSAVSADDQVRSLLHICASNTNDELAAAARQLLITASHQRFHRVAEQELLFAVGELWTHGWQPAELVRRARRADVRVGHLVEAAVAADHVDRHRANLHPRWIGQLEQLVLPEVAKTGWIVEFAAAERLEHAWLVATVTLALDVLFSSSPLHQIIPPPGSSAGSIRDTEPATDDPVLVRVRALLAQAESTSFEAEAETFNAKAQELMARHAIDMAMLWAATSRDERPATIRIPIDDPYASIKSLLLQCVAQRSRCVAVWDDSEALSTVVGFASDLSATELMFTSLLVQSQTAMHAAGVRGGPGSRARSRNFRSSFLMAFTQRIDERLARINAAIEGQVEGDVGGETLLPVLASRSGAVQETVEGLFGELRSSTVRGGSDALGWSSGRLAGDMAKLNAADLGPEPAAGGDDDERRARSLTR